MTGRIEDDGSQVALLCLKGDVRSVKVPTQSRIDPQRGIAGDDHQQFVKSIDVLRKRPVKQKPVAVDDMAHSIERNLAAPYTEHSRDS